MSGKIIVGYDGSDESRDALALAKLMTRTHGGELLVVSILVHGPLPISSEAFAEWEQAHAARIGAQARTDLDDSEAEVMAISDISVPRALHGAAEELDAEMIVLGSTHRGALGRVLPGSVGQRLLSAAPCALCIAPRGYSAAQAGGFSTIGVAYEGSRESRAALQTATEIAAAAGADVRLIGVLDPKTPIGFGNPSAPSPPPPLPAIETRQARHREVERTLDSARAALPSDLQPSAEIREGNVARCLAEASVDVDLLVIGSRAYGPLGRVLLGGVATELMRKAACPLLVVPRARQSEDSEAAPHSDVTESAIRVAP